MAGIASLEKRLVLDTYGKLLWQLRRQPWHAALYLAGVFLPPHERFWLGVFFGDTKENNVVASRGTSKSFTHASLAAPLKALLYKSMKVTTLSASGFRGGKELFKDAERLFVGQLKSQEMYGEFLQKSVVGGGRVLTRDPSMWEIRLKSHSVYNTAPTNNPDQLRGLRSNVLLIDERNTFEGSVVAGTLRPMLNVGMDFKRAAKGGDQNQLYQISTIDFTVRDWYPELQHAEDLQKRQYAARQAQKQGDWDEYDRLMNEKEGQLKAASFSMTRIDYTDLLIPQYVKTLDGERVYRVEYPREKGIEVEDLLRVDEHSGVAFWYTYPVDKKGLEGPLLAGTTDVEVWLSEQRNIFIASSGNVFSHDLIQKVSERAIPVGKGAKRKKGDTDDDGGESQDEFFAPVMYACGDPCVLGVDVARESDETAFTVIRLGELAEGDFSPFVERFDKQGRPVLGKTRWNHIVWAESHRHLEAHVAADKIRELKARYNIIYTATLPGIGMDKRGGGSAVRDELGNPKPDVIAGLPNPDWRWDAVVKIYDREDKGGFAHYMGQEDDGEYWGGLRLIATDNNDNRDWTFALRAMMQQGKMYLGFWMPPSRWAFEKGLLGPNGEPDRLNPEYVKWEVGYTGIRRLKMQLLRLQTKVSDIGTMRFVVPGNKAKDEGKKDLWASAIYATSVARDHINAQTVQDADVPMVAAVVINMGGGSGIDLGYGFAGYGGL